jgi:hypothetical protein
MFSPHTFFIFSQRYSSIDYICKITFYMKEPIIKSHNKQEYPPMHTAEFETSSIIMYITEDNQISLDVKLENDTVWLSQSQMAVLFDTDRTSILRHIKNIYKIGELEENSTCAKNAQVRIEGARMIT